MDRRLFFVCFVCGWYSHWSVELCWEHSASSHRHYIWHNCPCFILGSFNRVWGLQGPSEPIIFVPFYSCYQIKRPTFKKKCVLHMDSSMRQELTHIWPIIELWHVDWNWACLYRNAETTCVGPGLFLLPLPVLWSGIHIEFSDTPTLPIYKVWSQR